jgi:hypothetical protein
MQYINLRRQGLSDEDASMLADALKSNTSATNITLFDNTIGAEGAPVLADALKVNTSVTRVNLVTMQSVLKVHRRWLMR